MVWFTRKRAASGEADYLSCKFEVLGGRHKGSGFFSMVNLNLNQRGAVTRLQIWMRIMGIQEEWEIGDSEQGTGQAGDANWNALFRFKPFGALVSRERSGAYVNNNIERFVFPNDWPDEWATWAAEWSASRMARNSNPEDFVEDAGDPDPDYIPEDPESPPAAPQSDWEDDDDDIPF
jgi:hypothetical protein